MQLAKKLTKANPKVPTRPRNPSLWRPVAFWKNRTWNYGQKVDFFSLTKFVNRSQPSYFLLTYTPDEECSAEVFGQLASEGRKATWVDPRVEGFIPVQPNHANAGVLNATYRYVLDAIYLHAIGMPPSTTLLPLKQKHIIYQLTILLRYVSNLETHVKKLDDEYDAVNLVLAKGQMDNYGNTLPD